MDYEREQITFEIKEHIGVVYVYHTGWKKELNLVSWNGNAPKYDIRDWDPGHSRMSRGVTLKEQEMRQIVELLRRRRPHRRDREQEQGVMVDMPMESAECFAEAPAASVPGGQSQTGPMANRQSQEAERPAEESLQGSMQEPAEPQQIPEPQETAASRETDDDFFVPEAQNLDAATEGGCSCCV